jgi:hypothetical protein
MSLPILSIIDGAIDKLFPDAGDRLKYKNQAKELELSGEFKELEGAIQLIMAEAQSKDPWTSRARPSFLYVMYIMILASIPMGFLSFWHPELVDSAIAGMDKWLKAIPPEMWYLFGVGYLGYVKKRSDDKQVLAGIKPTKILGIF